MAVSIKDLAELAGVSVSTVTRALADKPDVGKQTRKRILELAEKHNYQPNILARGLVTSRSFTVGVIVPDLTNPFFPELIKGVESTLWNAGYSVILADTDWRPEKERQIVAQFIARMVDGLIIAPIETKRYHTWIDQIRAAGVPVVSLTRLEHHDADTVIASDRFGARTAVEHLIRAGRTRVLYVGNDAAGWANGEREAGLREAFAEAGLSLSAACIERAPEGSIEAARKCVLQASQRGCDFNAVVAFDDLMALGVRAGLAELRKRIPDDVALIGFDNIELSALPDIDLTTVDIPKAELGRVSAQLVLERITERVEQDNETTFQGPYKEIVLNTRLVVRGSTSEVGAGADSDRIWSSERTPAHRAPEEIGTKSTD